MLRQDAWSIFRPSWLSFIMTAVFIPVAIFGSIQTYAFTCGGSGYKCVDTGIEKPPLYDEIRGYPFWSIWVYTSMPLFPLENSLANAMGYNDPGKYVFFGINFAYYYVASCIVAFFVRNLAHVKWFDNAPKANAS